MEIRLIAVGKLREPYVAQACQAFRKRLKPYCAYAEVEIRAADGSHRDAAMRTESERIRKLLAADERVWLLDRAGSQLTSESLSERLTAMAGGGASRLTLVVGGAYGTDSALRERSEFVWSLSELTFLHEWARMIVLEQLYRAAKIARNEPYHH